VSHPQPEVDGLPQKGDVLDGKYVIESPLGAGGMGVVYTAMNRDLAQPVAIKLLLPEAASHPHAVARFLREAQAAAAIQNDHVVRVYGVGKTNRGLPFMVMEHLSGSGLNDVLRDRGPFSISDAVDLVTEVCQALAHAHALGIVHRDIKPSNLFLCNCPDGSQRIKVLDFGISKVASMPGQVQVQLTATIQVLGTPAYMSPEQARSSKDVDATTDIWALGAVLYELLCGIPPFHAETLPALVAKIVADDPVRPSRLRTEVPEPLEDVILQCLEKMPARRPANIMQLAFALRPFASERGRANIDLVCRGSNLETMPTSLRLDVKAATPLSKGVTMARASLRRQLGVVVAVSTAAASLVVFVVWMVLKPASVAPSPGFALVEAASNTSNAPPPVAVVPASTQEPIASAVPAASAPPSPTTPVAPTVAPPKHVSPPRASASAPPGAGSSDPDLDPYDRF